MLSTSNRECPFCGNKMVGINARMDSGVITINCTNKECNATIDFKTKDMKQTMKMWETRAKHTDIGIKPCPYCGEDARIYTDGVIYAICCETIGCHGSRYAVIGGWTSKEKAIELWNR